MSLSETWGVPENARARYAVIVQWIGYNVFERAAPSAADPEKKRQLRVEVHVQAQVRVRFRLKMGNKVALISTYRFQI